MDDNALSWSCNKKKFMYIMCFKNSPYKEKLGWKCNSFWYFQISQRRYRGRPSYPSLYFEVTRDSRSCPVQVCAALSSKTLILIDKEINFFENDRRKYLGEQTINDKIGYDLDLILVFPQVTQITTIPQDNTLISKIDDLSSDLQQMLKIEQLADVTLKCDTISLEAHKCILSARSTVFATMFAIPMQERETNTVIISDMSPTVFNAMIRFIYCGQVQIQSSNMACDLLYAAEKYQITALKSGCVNYLKSILSKENVISIIQLADLYDEQLKMVAVCFIKDHLNEFEDTAEWFQFKLEKPTIASEVYSEQR